MKKLIFGSLLLLIPNCTSALTFYPPACNGPADDFTRGPGSYGSSPRDVTFRTGLLNGECATRTYDRSLSCVKAPARRIQTQTARSRRTVRCATSSAC